MYFFMLVVFGAFFILNYFLAVFMDSFSAADAQIRKKRLHMLETEDSEKKGQTKLISEGSGESL